MEPSEAGVLGTACLKKMLRLFSLSSGYSLSLTGVLCVCRPGCNVTRKTVPGCIIFGRAARVNFRSVCMAGGDVCTLLRDVKGRALPSRVAMFS